MSMMPLLQIYILVPHYFDVYFILEYL
jgi:hypothetical protein